MLTMQTDTEELTAYEMMIQEATGAPPEILAILERIMRDEIFHSTLDWQTSRQFNTAARKAYKMYCEARPLYDADQNLHSARWAACLAESALIEARESGDASAIHEAEEASAAADAAHERALQDLLSLC